MSYQQDHYRSKREGDLIAFAPVQLSLFDDEPGPLSCGYLYAAWRHGWIKIGYSVKPPRRMTELRAALLATTDRDKTKRDEDRVHMVLRPFHMAHEWYHPAPQVIAWVVNLPHQHDWPPPVVHLAA